MSLLPSIGQMFRSAGVYTLGVMASKVVSVLLIPVYTRYITPADNAVLEILDTTLTLFSLIMGARFAAAIAYFYAHAGGEAERREVVSTMMIGGACIGAAGAVIGFAAAPWISGHLIAAPVHALRITFAGFATSMLFEIALGWIRCEDRAGWFAVLSLVHLSLNVLINVTLLTKYQMSYEAVLWGGVVSGFLLGLPAAVYGVATAARRFNRALFVSICRFAAPIGVAGLAAFVLHFGERYFLYNREEVSKAELGVYLWSYKLGMIVSFVQTGFNSYWNSRSYQQVQGDTGPAMLARVYTYLTTAMTFISLVVWAWSPALVQAWADPSYHGALVYAPWIILAYWIRATADYFRSVFYICRNSHADAAVSMQAAAICLAAYAILIPVHGIAGAVAATLIGFSVFAVLSFRKAQRLMPFPLERERLVKLGVLTALLAGAFFVQPLDGPWGRVIAALAVSLAFPVGLLLLRFFDNEEMGYIRRAAGSFGLRVAQG